MGARSRAGFERALIAAFGLLLLAPALDHVLRPAARADVRREDREPAPFPTFDGSLASLDAWPRGVDDWAADALGLRDVLLAARSRLRYGIFGVSPSPRIVVGQDDWLFLSAMGILDARRGVAPLSEERLARWQRTLESRRAFCESLGAEFVFVLAPEKSTIYPERLPAGYARVGPSPLDQLVDRLARRSSVRVLDLRDVLLAEKARDRGRDFAYFPLGTHWTDRGLYAAYVRILEQLGGRFPGLAPRPASALGWQLAPDQGDSWAGRLRLETVLRQESQSVREIEGGYDCELGRSDAQQTQVWTRGADPSAPRLALLHDSFGDRLRKLLAPHFSYSYLAWRSDFDTEVLLRERPDVVIQVYAERALTTDRPQPVRVPGDLAQRAEFEAAREVLFRLDPARVPCELRAVGGTLLEPGPAGLVVEQRAGADMLELPDVEWLDGRTHVLRVELGCEQEGWVDVLYRTPDDARYRHGHTFSGAVRAGRSEVLIEMSEVRLRGPLRVRLGRGAGRFRLYALELRALPG